MRFSAGALVPRKRRSTDAGSFMLLWVVVLISIPANLTVAALGAAGAPAQILGLGALVWWIAFQLDKTTSTITPGQPIRLAMILFIMALLASYLMAASRPIEADELSATDRGVLLALSWLGILVLTSDGLVSRARLDTLLHTLVYAAGALGALGLLQFFTHQSFVDAIEIPGLTSRSALNSVFDRNGLARVAGTSTHPIEFGVFLAMVLPIAIHYASVTPGSRLKRWWPVVTIATTIPLTVSRSAVLGLLVVLVMLLPTFPTARRLWALLWVVVGLGAIYISVPGMLGTMTRLFTNISGDDSAQSRVDSYGLALSLFSHSPIFGRGFSTFLPRYRILDNQYLGLLVDTGVVGIVSFVALLVTGVVVALRARKLARSAEDRSLAISLATTTTVIALAFATFDAFAYPQVTGLLFLTLGCITVLSRSIRLGLVLHRAPVSIGVSP